MKTTIEQAEKERRSILANLDLREDDGWQYDVRNIVVVLSTSRSGSSLVYQALITDPSVIAPAGEQEPWLFLSQNKYPYTDSDALKEIANEALLLGLMRNDLLVREPAIKREELWLLLKNRLIVRGESESFISKIGALAMDQLPDMVSYDEWLAFNEQLLALEAPITEVAVRRGDFLAIEDPPYIVQPTARRFEREELATKTLVFKSPSDAYRPGFFERLFPNATVRYVHLTRGFAQTSNGLMDGWLKDPIGFISNNVGELNLDGYSFPDISDTYWCFDLFPGWQSFRSRSLFSVCLMQWMSATKAILEYYPDTPRIAFEQFYTDKKTFIEKLEALTGLDTSAFDWGELVMSTDKPADFRWRKREVLYSNILSHLSQDEYNELTELQKTLGYSMDSTTWH